MATGKYLREFPSATELDGESIIAVSEDSTDETYKSSTNNFTRNLEVSNFKNTGIKSSLGLIVSGAPASIVNLDSMDDYAAISAGSIIVLSGAELVVLKKVAPLSLVIDPPGAYASQTFDYWLPYIATIDLGGNVGTYINKDGLGVVGDIQCSDDISTVSGSISTALGNVEATIGTVTAGSGITATAGDINVLGGSVDVSGTITAGSDITSTAGTVSGGALRADTGDIIALLGSVVATVGTITAGSDITSTAGDLLAPDGGLICDRNVQAGGLVSCSGLRVDIGDINVVDGNIEAYNGGIECGDNMVTLNGYISAPNGVITAGSDIIAGGNLTLDSAGATVSCGTVTHATLDGSGIIDFPYNPFIVIEGLTGGFQQQFATGSWGFIQWGTQLHNFHGTPFVLQYYAIPVIKTGMYRARTKIIIDTLATSLNNKTFYAGFTNYATKELYYSVKHVIVAPAGHGRQEFNMSGIFEAYAGDNISVEIYPELLPGESLFIDEDHYNGIVHGRTAHKVNFSLEWYGDGVAT